MVIKSIMGQWDRVTVLLSLSFTKVPHRDSPSGVLSWDGHYGVLFLEVEKKNKKCYTTKSYADKLSC
jgi:hypothetical protein